MLPTSTQLATRRVIAIASDKGGVFKTSTVSNVAGLLAAADYRCLAIDFDPQGNLGEDLGITERGDDGENLYQALVEGVPLTPLKDVRPNLDVLTGGEYVYAAQEALDRLALTDFEAARTRLAFALEPLAPTYDVILIDTPPKIRSLQEVALVASRWLVVPSKSDTSSHKGVTLTSARFEAAREINPSLGLLGVLLVGSSASATRIKAEARQRLSTALGDERPLMQASVRHVEGAAVDARERGLLAHELEVAAVKEAQDRPWYRALREPGTSEKRRRLAESAGSLAGDYQSVAEELIDRLAQNEALIAEENA